VHQNAPSLVFKVTRDNTFILRCECNDLLFSFRRPNCPEFTGLLFGRRPVVAIPHYLFIFVAELNDQRVGVGVVGN